MRRKDKINERTPYPIGIDLLGSDTPSEELLESILEHAPHFPSHLKLVLLGTEGLFENKNSGSRNISFHPVKEYISMEEPPLEAIRKKPDSSICIGIQMLKEKQIEAFISAGNTGALMGSAKWQLSPLPNIERPALLTLLPTQKSDLAVIDVGANTTCRAKYLLQYAAMGIAYQKSRGIEMPRVGLLNIGSEACKGVPELKTTYEALKRLAIDPSLHFSFSGNIEGRDVFHGNIDVLVTDGFTGNIFLKTAEGIATVILEQVERTALENGSYNLSSFEKIHKRLHYAEYPGALLCGIEGIVIKCHGNLSSQSLIRSIFIATDLIENSFIDQIKQVLTDYSLAH